MEIQEIIQKKIEFETHLQAQIKTFVNQFPDLDISINIDLYSTKTSLGRPIRLEPEVKVTISIPVGRIDQAGRVE